jgi:copper chaperone NosL
MNRRELLILVGGATLAQLAGCTDGAPSITWDLDSCEHCRMTISDRRFGAAAVTSGGRTLRFDSLECLADWLATSDDNPRSLWGVDAAAAGVLLPLADLRFHRLSEGSSPMGMGYIAVAASRASTAWDGPELSWEQIEAAVHEREARGTLGGIN